MFIPRIFENLLSDNVINALLINVLVGCGHHIAVVSESELVMRPEAMIECEVMLFFIFLFVLVEDCGIVLHLDTADAA